MEMTAEQQKLVTDHMHIADAMAAQVWRTAPYALELDELKSLAYMGLVMAAMRWDQYCAERGFDPTKLQYFVPYVQRRSRGAVMDALRTQDWANRSLRSRHKMLLKAGLERGATETELAARSGLSVAEVRSTRLGMARRPVSLDGENQGAQIGHEDEKASVESSAVVSELLTMTVETIKDLDETSQTVIALRYFMGLEIKEVAVRMGLTESRASHIHTDAVLKIHETLRSTALGDRDDVRAEGSAGTNLESSSALGMADHSRVPSSNGLRAGG